MLFCTPAKAFSSMQDSWVAGELSRARINGFGKCQERKCFLIHLCLQMASFSSAPGFMENFSGISFPFHRRGELRKLNLLAAKPVMLSHAFPRQGYCKEQVLVALDDWSRPREALMVLMKRFLQWPSVFVECKGSLEHGLFNSCGSWKPRECLETVQGPVMSVRSGLIQCGKSLLDLLSRRDVDLGCKSEHCFSAVS